MSPELAQPEVTNWAYDFQKLQLADNPTRLYLQSSFQESPPFSSDLEGDWLDSFHHLPAPASAQDLRLQEYGLNLQFPPQTTSDSAFYQSTRSATLETQQSLPDQWVESLVESAALDRAFETVTQESRQSELDVGAERAEYGKVSAQANITLNDFISIPGTKGIILTERVGSDRIKNRITKEERAQSQTNDADELARTAGELLNNVKHDQSQKFQNSTFFSLMRQLRDREVQVEGNKIVDVSIPLS